MNDIVLLLILFMIPVCTAFDDWCLMEVLVAINTKCYIASRTSQ